MNSTRFIRCMFAGALCSLLLVALTAPTSVSAAAQAVTNALPQDSRLDAEAAERIGSLPSVDIAALDASGAPTVLTVPKGTYRLDRGVRQAVEADIRRAADPLLRAQGYQPKDLTLRRQWVDDIGHLHAVFEQTLAGLPVVGGGVRVHFDPQGNLQSLSGIMRKSAHARLSASPAITSTAAETRGLERTRAQSKRAQKGRLVFLNSTTTGNLVLAWEVLVTGDAPDQPVSDLVYIDAATGEEIERHRQIHSARNRQIYDANQQSSWGSLARSEGGGASSDTDVNTNYGYMGQTYDYFWQVFGRDSYNGSGAAIRSTVDYRNQYNNAFWDETAERWAFGDGDGSTFTHFTSSRDVVAHEFMHAVTQFTSYLAYTGESGAINEAMSDIFGAMADAWTRGGGTPVVDANTWMIGEDIYTPGTPGDALRYMNDPTADGRWISYDDDWDPETPDVSEWVYSRDWYPDRYQGWLDAGGVHWNSGIANLAFTFAATGGRHPRWSQVGQPLYVPALGADAAQRIFYRANNEVLFSYPTLSFATFAQLRQATAQAAQDLAAVGQVPWNAAQIIHLAWDAVAVGGLPTGNARPMNISTRCDVGTGDGIAIAGFFVSGGSNPHDLLVRGIGPTLEQFNVPNYLSDPYLTLNVGGSPIASNNNWYEAWNASQIASTAVIVNAFPLPNPSLDSAILQSFATGGYTVHLTGVGGGTGNGMVEVYATDYNNPNHLVNISTRCLVTANPAIAGFVIHGEGYKRLLIRAVGPTLGSFGVPGTIADPKLILYVGGTAIRENDRWGTELNAGEIVAAAQTVGAFALQSDSHDAALLVDLPPGIYTAQMSGVSGSTGIGLVEVYEVN